MRCVNRTICFPYSVSHHCLCRSDPIKCTMDNVEVCKLMKVDELFRDKLLSIVDTQYENSDFSIEDLSEHLGLSRVHLYRKMKTLFGVSPTDYLRNYRLNKAMLLLKARQYNISEIAYMTGFTSHGPE